MSQYMLVFSFFKYCNIIQTKLNMFYYFLHITVFNLILKITMWYVHYYTHIQFLKLGFHARNMPKVPQQGPELLPPYSNILALHHYGILPSRIAPKTHKSVLTGILTLQHIWSFFPIWPCILYLHSFWLFQF